MLRTFSDNPTCRHIIFGGCHDAGYLLNLEQFKHNERKAASITLLETTPAFRGFAELLHFKRARFESVFRSQPLPDSVSLPFVNTTTSSAPAMSTPTPAQSPGLLRTNTNQSPKPSVTDTSPSTPPSSITGPESNGDGSWGMCTLSRYPEVSDSTSLGLHMVHRMYSNCVAQQTNLTHLTHVFLIVY
jgi:hypothetical protein